MVSYLITGGSGFLGINIVRYLLKKGHKVRVLDRVDFEYPELSKIEFIGGDIRNRKKVIESLNGIEIVVHCAAALPLYSAKEIFTTDVNGTRILLEESKKAKVKRFIHISSTAVYGIPDHHPLFEHDKLIGVGPYGKAKILAEKECEKFRKQKMCVPILRPKSFIGPERLGVFDLYYDWIRRGKSIPIVGSGKNRYQLLDVEDLCEAIYLCATLNTRTVNDTFNIGAEEFTTMKEDFGSVIEYAKTGKRIVPTPAAPLIAVLRTLEFFKLSPLYKWVYETAPHDSFVSIEKAKRKLKFVPKYSNKETLIRNYQWYVKNYKKFEGKSGVTHRLPWKQGILKFVSYFF